MKEYVEKIKSGHNLDSKEIQDVMKQIMNGSASRDDMSDFLLALREKGPTADEITGAAKIMREFLIPVRTKHEIILDTCGTGGDKKGTFNISTISALVVAGAGVSVAKHGNRSVSSKCGSADVLEALGVKVILNPEQVSECLDHLGIAFLFAQRLHPAMKHAAPVRKELGVETIFNVLGPLANPAHATHQIMGVYHHDLVEPMANVLKNLGIKRALVVHGNDGLDEVTTTDKTFMSEAGKDGVRSYSITPEELNIKPAKIEDLLGGDLNHNAQIALDILNGKTGPKRDIVTLNAGCALYISEAAKTIAEGIKLASESIDSGKALEKLDKLKDFTNKI